MSATSWMIGIAGLMVGAGGVIAGLWIAYGDVPDREESGELAGFAELGGKVLGWPVVLIGATILCVTLAYVVSRRGTDDPPRRDRDDG